MTTTIHSDRLDLVPLCPAFLRAVLDQNIAEAERLLASSVPYGLLDSADVMALRLTQLEADPTFQPWSLRAMVSENVA